jgi:hypothetical protein
MHRALTRKVGAPTLALSLILAAFGEAHAFDFKGLSLGEPITPAEIEARLDAGCKGANDKPCDNLESKIYETSRMRCGEGWEGSKVCNGVTTVAGLPAQANIVIGANGRLRRVYLTRLSPDDFDVIRSELVSKFGPPKKTANPLLHNGFGASFRQAQVTWLDAKRHKITLSKYAGTTDEASLYFGTPEDEESTAKARGKKGDL